VSGIATLSTKFFDIGHRLQLNYQIVYSLSYPPWCPSATQKLLKCIRPAPCCYLAVWLYTMKRELLFSPSVKVNSFRSIVTIYLFEVFLHSFNKLQFWKKQLVFLIHLAWNSLPFLLILVNLLQVLDSKCLILFQNKFGNSCNDFKGVLLYKSQHPLEWYGKLLLLIFSYLVDLAPGIIDGILYMPWQNRNVSWARRPNV